jgi:hypothetical protein
MPGQRRLDARLKASSPRGRRPHDDAHDLAVLLERAKKIVAGWIGEEEQSDRAKTGSVHNGGKPATALWEDRKSGNWRHGWQPCMSAALQLAREDR